MLLRVIPMICFEILSVFLRKLQKGKLGKHELLRCSVGNPCRGITLRHRVGCPYRGEAGVPKWHPSGTLQRSFAMPQHSNATLQRRHCS